MARVYVYVLCGVAVSTLAAYGAGLSGFYLLIYLTPLFWVIAIAPLVLAVVTSFALEKISVPMAHLLFWSYAVFIGLSFAGIFLVYAGRDTALVLGAIAAVFALASCYGYFTHRDLSGLARFLLIGLLIIVLANIAAAFAGFQAFNIIVMVSAAIIMAGLVASDTQHTRRRYELAPGLRRDEIERTAITGALALYLDLVIFSPGLARIAGFISSRAVDLGRLGPLVANEIEHQTSDPDSKADGR
jgi:FtsH-binding integral membrane protein